MFLYHLSRSTRFLIKIALISLGGAVWSSGIHAAGWQVAAFNGKPVSLVVANQRNPQEMAAIAGGSLQISHDQGKSWIPGLLSVPANTLAFDLVYSGRMYAGTSSGVYISDNGGMTWEPFGSSITRRKIVTAIQTTDQYVFAAMYDGAGTPVRVWRLAQGGEAEDMGLPSDSTAAFDYDFGSHRLYVGAAGGVYQSGDQGSTWSGGGGAGLFTTSVIVKAGVLWQLCADGLYRSNDNGASWNKLAAPGTINGTFYGQEIHLSGLAVSGNQAFYGAWSIMFPYHFLVEYDGSAARSLMDAKINSVARTGNQIWAASETGLWVNDSLSLNHPSVQRPVLVIPGILGSLPTTPSLAAQLPRVFTGFWDRSYQSPLVLDPITHTYDGLLQTLAARGYTYDKTLFVFPYNWMQDNALTAAQLAQKLYDIRQICQCTQVDVVAHSMGGLIARSYIGSTYYQNDIRNLIQIATPNAGSLAVYEVWEGGTVSAVKPDSSSQLLNLAVRALTDPNSAVPRAEFMRTSVPSIGQLLPIFDYLAGRHYPIGYPLNPYLEHLNVPAEIRRLKDRVALYVVGGNSRRTVQVLDVSSEDDRASLWPHGRIMSSSWGSGDGTVLLSSLEAAAKSSLVLDADHLQVVSAAAPFVAQVLMGEYVADVSTSMWPQQRLLTVYAAGPVALSLIDSKGRSINDTVNGVPGAYYSGSSLKPQLAVVPYEQRGDYTISLKAVGAGQYRVGVSELETGEASSSASSANSAPDPSQFEKSGYLAAGQTEQYVYKSLDRQLARIDSAADMGASGAVALRASWSASGPGSQPSLSNVYGFDAEFADVEGGMITRTESYIEKDSDQSAQARGYSQLGGRKPAVVQGFQLLTAVVIFLAFLSLLWAYFKQS